jgi:acetyltransferase
MNFTALFNPRRIAVIGANAEEGHVGYALMQNLLADQRERQIIPVTEKFSEVFGIPTVPSVSAVSEEIDLVVIAVASDRVPVVLRECGAKGVPAAIVISAGFKEVGGEGLAREAELGAIAQEFGMVLVGPNCLGVINAVNGMNASFSAGGPRGGSIAFVSQSGAIATSLIDWSLAEGVGFSKIVSLGNEARLSEIEFLEYLRDDEETKAILMYLEHINDGPRFMQLLSEVTTKKPVVILRAGRSARGGKAVMSHTGSLAPDDAIFAAAVAQSGAIAVDTLRDVFSFARLFQMGITQPLRRLVIVTNGGGPSVNTADLIDLSHSLTLVQFDEETKESLRNVLPSMAAVGNPIDVIGDAGSKRYEDTLALLVDRQDIDGIIVIVTPQMMTNDTAIASSLLSFHARKPIIPTVMGGAARTRALSVLREAGMVNFAFPTDAVIALDLLARGAPKEEQAVTAPPATTPSLNMMGMEEVQQLLGAYGIPLSGVFVRERSLLAGAVATLPPGQFALKAISQAVVHKSDAGAVRIKLDGIEGVEHAWDEITGSIMAKHSSATIDGMIVQPMASGREVIIGMKRDRTFGPVVVFGLGGIFVEVLKDVSMRVAPLSREEALKQIDSIRSRALLSGVRGEAPVDKESLATILVAISHLSLEHPEILEIDLNPVMVGEHGSAIVDARFMLRAE